jgi:hypothetical protein
VARVTASETWWALCLPPGRFSKVTNPVVRSTMVPGPRNSRVMGVRVGS